MPVLKIKNNGVWEQVGGIPDHTHVVDDITDFPTSLPANGGNADTVDGKHASDFASAAEMTTVQNNINDINTMLDGIEIPTTLPNPKAITFTGAVNTSYDGSSEMSVEIPDVSGKMDKNNPTGTGSFSLNRKDGTAIGTCSHAEGGETTASGRYSHAEGWATTASGDWSHSEGNSTTASGDWSHSEGQYATASGSYSHAEGQGTASGPAAHAEGSGGTKASGNASHAEGYGTTASSSYQHTQGKYNIEDSSGIYADIIGNGASKTKRSNAATVDWSGNAWYAGDVYVGSTSGTNKDSGSKKLATEEYVDNSTAGIEIPQADWNQNDETAPDYVKNRPFYTGDPVEAVLVEESTVEFEDFGDGIYLVDFQSTFEATVGETYKVSWDGSTYECTCVDIEGTLALGNLSIIGTGSDTGEPFLIAVFNGEGIQIGTEDTSASHTISISGMVIPAVKIDEKYLPDTTVKYTASQNLTDAQKKQARTNIGAGTSSFSGSWNDLTDKPFKPAGKSYLTFSSLSSFNLRVNDATKHWDGTLEYFASDKTWTTWDGTSALSSVADDGEYVLYLRGTRNTIIAGDSQNYRWVLNGTDIACIGNIENLLDYVTVESGGNPTMANYCYANMFKYCASLTQAPALPATTLVPSCYASMFESCTRLTQAPALPATTLVPSCYKNMFEGCTRLTQAPALPATTLAEGCYIRMFYYCTSLTQAPALPATTLAEDCYASMFSYCTSLTQAPALPATTLVPSCYASMFSYCTSLTQAPALPATTLVPYCYGYMFYGCTSLKLSSTKTDEYTQEYRIPSSGNSTTATDALANMFTSTGGTFTGTPKINTTYYLSSNNMIVRETDIATLNGYVGSMINAALNAIGVAEEGAY